MSTTDATVRSWLRGEHANDQDRYTLTWTPDVAAYDRDGHHEAMDYYESSEPETLNTFEDEHEAVSAFVAELRARGVAISLAARDPQDVGRTIGYTRDVLGHIRAMHIITRGTLRLTLTA